MQYSALLISFPTSGVGLITPTCVLHFESSQFVLSPPIFSKRITLGTFTTTKSLLHHQAQKWQHTQLLKNAYHLLCMLVGTLGLHTNITPCQHVYFPDLAECDVLKVYFSQKNVFSQSPQLIILNRQPLTCYTF